MREIKFRAKNLKGFWVVGVPIQSVNERWYMTHGATEDAVNTRNEVDFIFSEIDGKTIGQFTGLKDKHGKEIYEGDVVWHNYFKEIGCMIFHEKQSAFCLLYRDGKTQEMFPIDYKSFKVRGNIYENPELLEKGQVKS